MDDDATGFESEPTQQIEPPTDPAATAAPAAAAPAVALPATQAPAEPAAPAAARPSWRTLAVPVIAALIVGIGAGYALNDLTSSAGASSAGRGGFPALGGGRAPSGGFGQAQDQGGFGGVQGEERIQGTVTAKTASTVSIKSSSGTATYTVDSTSQIVADGQVATLADVKVGDTVFAHIVPSSSSSGGKMVERLFVGTLPQGGPGAPPGSGGQPGSTQSQTQTF